MWFTRQPWTHSVPILLLLVGSEHAHGQQATIPDTLAQVGHSLIRVITVPSGPPPDIQRILEDADTVVKGVVGNPTSYLSTDQSDVLTDYPITEPAILYQTRVAQSQRPGLPQVTVTLFGGSVEIAGLTFTSRAEALLALEPGIEALFLLKRIGEQYYLAGRYFGAFRIADGNLMPLVKKDGFAPEYRNAPAVAATEELVARRRSLP